MSDLVGNPEDRFSRVTAQLILHSCGSMKHFKLDDLVLRVYQVEHVCRCCAELNSVLWDSILVIK